MKISVLGNKGSLSKALKHIILKKDNEFYTSFSAKRNDYNFLIATFSPTMRTDDFDSMKKEINYYKTLITNLKPNDFLIYISSQTLELTNNTFYSKSKNKVEELIQLSVGKHVIIRPGMIFDEKNFRYNLDSMHKASNSIFTFFGDFPKTTACTINDIVELIFFIIEYPNKFKKQIINVGVKRMNFNDLQNIGNKKKFRFKLLSFRFIKLFSFFNTRLRAYSFGSAIKSSPSLAWLSTFDK